MSRVQARHFPWRDARFRNAMLVSGTDPERISMSDTPPPPDESSHGHPSHGQASHGQATPRRLFAVAVAAAVVGLVLTLSFGFADHSPAPHGVRLAVAARRPGARAGGRPRAPGTGRLHRRGRVVRKRGDRQRPRAVHGRRPDRRPDRTGDDRDGGRGGSEPAAGDLGGAHRRGDRAAPSGAPPRRRAAARRRPRGPVRVRLRARPAAAERARQYRRVPDRQALPAVVAGHRRGAVRRGGRLWQRART